MGGHDRKIGMSQSTVKMGFVGATLIALVTGRSALAAEPTYGELEQQIQRLSAQVQKLEAAAQKERTTSTTQAVLEDARRRGPSLGTASPLMAGYEKGKGFFIRSEDDNFLLRPGVQFQFRNVTNYRQDANNGGDDTQNGFEVRRLRPRLDGYILSPKLTYSFVFDTNRSGGAVTVLDAWAKYQLAPSWAIQAGQFKAPAFQEHNVGAFAQLAVDESLVDTLIGGGLTDRVQGINLIYGDKNIPLGGSLSFHDGANSKNSDFQDGSSDFGVGGRIQYKFFGQWSDHKSFTAINTRKELLVAGSGFDLTQRDDANVLLATADLQYKNPSGLGLYGALHGDFTDTRNSTASDTQSWGMLAQVSQTLNDHLELFGRYDVVRLDGADAQTHNEITAGVNYYLDHGDPQRVKLSLDVGWLPDGAPSNQTGLGILAGDGNQFVLRTQFQFLL